MRRNTFFSFLIPAVALFLAGGLLWPHLNAAAQEGAPQAVTLALGTAFTYQGQLLKNGLPLTDTCDLRFKLYDAAAGGSQIGSPQTLTGVGVSSGLFTVQIDFGQGAFNGSGRWLQIETKCTGDGNFVLLAPRQPLTPAPYALALPGLYTQENATSPNVIGGYSGNSVSGGVVGATIGGGGAIGFPNLVTDDHGAVGGGLFNQAGDGSGATNERPYATVGGGYSNQATGWAATVGGGTDNQATNSASTIGGGQLNQATGWAATVGGGDSNQATAQWATVAGGLNNQAAAYATVGGGYSNQSAGQYATIGGGYGNGATAPYATTPGGFYAIASHYGELAYASGHFANDGDAQTSLYVLRQTTTGLNPVELFLDGVDDRLTIPAGSVWVFDILVVGRDQSNNSGAGYQITGVIERTTGGTTAFIGTPTITVLGEDVASWYVTVTADNTNDALTIFAATAGFSTTRWLAVVRTIQVQF